MNDSDAESELPGFRGQEAEALLRVGKKREISAQTVLCREGEVTDRFFVLTSGTVEVGKSFKGQMVCLQVCGPGTILCLLPALDESPCSVSIRALQEATLVEVSRDSLHAVLAAEHDPGLHLALALVVQSIRSLRRSTDELALAIYRALRSGDRPPHVGAVDLAQIQASNHAWLAA